MSQNTHYAGIGSRETPMDVLELMRRVALALESTGWTLRSGGALGADSAFAKDVVNKEIYIPWPRYNGIDSALSCVTPAAIEMALKYHPAPHKLTQGAQKLHGRNCHIVLGERLDHPVSFIICWTPGGKVSGGTGQALRLAKDYNIPVYNLANHDHRKVIESWCQTTGI